MEPIEVAPASAEETRAYWRSALVEALRRRGHFGFCIRCCQWFPPWELTNEFACSYLCVPCADAIREELFGEYLAAHSLDDVEE